MKVSMPATLKASEDGLKIVDFARRKKGWAKSGEVWCGLALTSKATLKRFWQGEAIRQDNFVGICQAVGIDNWEEIVDGSNQTSNSTSPNLSMDEEERKPEIDGIPLPMQPIEQQPYEDISRSANEQYQQSQDILIDSPSLPEPNLKVEAEEPEKTIEAQDAVEPVLSYEAPEPESNISNNKVTNWDNWEEIYKNLLEQVLVKIDKFFGSERNIGSDSRCSYFNFRSLLVCIGLGLTYSTLLTIFCYVISGNSPLANTATLNPVVRLFVMVVCCFVLIWMTNNQKILFAVESSMTESNFTEYSWIDKWLWSFTIPEDANHTDSKTDSLFVEYILNKITFINKQSSNKKFAIARWSVRVIAGFIFGCLLAGISQYFTGNGWDAIPLFLVAVIFGAAHAAYAFFAFASLSIFGNFLHKLFNINSLYEEILPEVSNLDLVVTAFALITLLIFSVLILLSNKLNFGFSGFLAGAFTLTVAVGVTAGFLGAGKVVIVLYLVVLPLINGVWDYLSWGASRLLLKKIIDSLNSDSKPVLGVTHGIAFFLAAIDMFLVFIFIIGTTATLVITTYFTSKMYLTASGLSPLPLQEIIDGVKTNPWEPKYFWITFMLLSTVLPTLIHFFIALHTSLLWALSRMPQPLQALSNSGFPVFNILFLDSILVGVAWIGSIALLWIIFIIVNVLIPDLFYSFAQFSLDNLKMFFP